MQLKLHRNHFFAVLCALSSSQQVRQTPVIVTCGAEVKNLKDSFIGKEGPAECRASPQTATHCL